MNRSDPDSNKWIVRSEWMILKGKGLDYYEGEE
jgi:hypothetical protein